MKGNEQMNGITLTDTTQLDGFPQTFSQRVAQLQRRANRLRFYGRDHAARKAMLKLKTILVTREELL
jgi:hypothetical protein